MTTKKRPARPASSSRKGGRGWKPNIEDDLKELIADHSAEEDKAIPSSIVADDDTLGVDAPLVRLVNSIIHEAVKRDVSDIHIEPFEGMLRVRFRIDGVMEEVQKIPYKLTPAIVSRIKIMADLDICEKRIPQDGVINFRMEDSGADLRVSTLPSAFGEKVVMRVLGTTNLNNDLAKLGIPEHQLKPMRAAIKKPNGLVLVTGPTGSGKTTTLYAGLNELNDISVSVFTAEDPVEGNLPGVTQCQVNNSVGFTFSSILRALLRQDPDVILVGEIRDKETAEIAIKASLTGHLVLSTLHTNCSVSTIQRLIDIGIKPYLITSSVNCIVAQRLVRRICEECKEQRTVPTEMLESLNIDPATLPGGKVFHGKGCDVCHGSGFKGRAPVYEVLVLNDELRKLILKGGSKVELKAAARMFGMQTLRESGLNLVRLGVSTIEEVLGRTAEDEEPQKTEPSGSGAHASNAEVQDSPQSAQMMQQMFQMMFQSMNQTPQLSQSELQPPAVVKECKKSQPPVVIDPKPPALSAEVPIDAEALEPQHAPPQEAAATKNGTPNEESENGSTAKPLEELMAELGGRDEETDLSEEQDEDGGNAGPRWKRNEPASVEH